MVLVVQQILAVAVEVVIMTALAVQAVQES
jgi:hypothetical protein